MQRTESRYSEVRRVLVRILFLNLAVALAKVIYGQVSGSVSILSDGFHSLTDAASNVVALIGLQLAQKPPDANHPYGHRKFETLAAGGIALFLLIVVVEVAQTAILRFQSGGAPRVTVASFAVMLGTLAINIAVVRAERAAAHRLSSELLLADARHTQSDVLTSIAVIAALAGSAYGYPVLDPLAALVIVGFIGSAGFEIAREAARILSDQIVISEEDVRRVVQSVPHVLGCHHIRSRGSADHVFLDLHVWMDGATPLIDAHAVSHDVKDRLMEQYPQIVDAIIHIEPPPRG
ncbi:MAG TPA: cation diffusion facilitator family transporter [Vicinamibacterales bacterium]|nr:cation diffusion facilitator family transporter [Vicinamibacterales bacterium]